MVEIYEHIMDYIINTNSVLIVVQDEVVSYSNFFVEKLFKTKLVGRNIFEFINPQFEGLIRFRIQRSIDGYRLKEIELKYRAADNSPVYLSTVLRNIYFKGEKALLVMGRDLTTAKQVEGVLIDVLMRYLSGREGEFLHYSVRGLSRREIAREMGITPETVKTYPQRIKDKLGLDQDGLSALVDYVMLRDFYT